MTHPIAKKFMYAAFAWTICSVTTVANAKTLKLYGWETLPKTATPELAFAVGDPFLGNLVCPALTRLSLASGKQDLVLLTKVSEASGPKNSYEWQMQIKPGIRWWSGDEVEAKDLVKFFETFLSREIKRQSLGVWSIPPFSAQAVDKTTVKVVWDSKPGFGPYIFSAWPLMREQKKGEVEYECVGSFAPSSSSEGQVKKFALAKNANNKFDFQDIEIISGDEPATGDLWLDFRFPTSKTSHPKDRPSDRPANCDSVDAPILSMITWNPNRPYTDTSKIRQLYTQLMPRGELLRAGAAYLGELVSGPIPREHPGYNRAMLVRPFNIEKTSDELEKSGYKRKTANGWRQSPDGKKFTLKLLTQSKTPGLVEKVLTDAFAAVGIETMLTSNRADFPDVDGVIAGVRLPWPSNNLLPVLHSKAAKAEPFWPLGDKSTDQLLEQYALSLTKEKPDFGQLRKTHTRLFALEPFTLLVQHKLCMQAAPGTKYTAKGANTNDPDWLVKILGK